MKKIAYFLLIVIFLSGCSIEKDDYLVTFHSNGGTEVAAVKVKRFFPLEKPSDPLKENAKFGGWYLDNDTFLSKYHFYTSVESDLDLYARWLSFYTIKFNTNGGNRIEDQIVTEDIEPAFPATPIKKGYKFNGWYEDEALTVEVSDIKNIKANKTLYAKWIAKNQYTVTFDSNGGSSVDSVLVYEEDKLEAPEIPIKEGYRFKGWFTENVTFENEFIFSQKIIESNITLYAKWMELKKFTVSFDTAGGTNVRPIEVYEGDSISAPRDPNKTGYLFIQWENESGEKVYFDSMTINKDMTLKAKWRYVNLLTTVAVVFTRPNSEVSYGISLGNMNSADTTFDYVLLHFFNQNNSRTFDKTLSSVSTTEIINTVEEFDYLRVTLVNKDGEESSFSQLVDFCNPVSGYDNIFAGDVDF